MLEFLIVLNVIDTRLSYDVNSIILKKTSKKINKICYYIIIYLFIIVFHPCNQTSKYNVGRITNKAPKSSFYIRN